jgi:plastocyanin
VDPLDVGVVMNQRRRRGGFAVALAAVLALGSACADEGPGDAASTGSTGGAAATGPTGATASSGATGAGDPRSDDAMGDAGGGGGRYDYGTDDGSGSGTTGADVTLAADNFAFAPAEIELAAGEELSVKNANASTPHTFTVEGTDIDLELDPGEIEKATLDLDPGTYAFLCRFHPQMTGTLTVA